MLTIAAILAAAMTQRPYLTGRCPSCGARCGIRCPCEARRAVSALCRDLSDAQLGEAIGRIGMIDSREGRQARGVLETERDARMFAIVDAA